MINFLESTIRIIILLKLMQLSFMWLCGKRKRSTVFYKINRLIKNKIHYRLDRALERQKEAYMLASEKKVLPFKEGRTKRIKQGS